MPLTLNAEAAADLTDDIKFNISGEDPGRYHLHFEGGACTLNEGASPAPTLTIQTLSEIWLSISATNISRGELDGQMAFMQQKYTVEGVFSLPMKLNQMFMS